MSIVWVATFGGTKESREKGFGDVVVRTSDRSYPCHSAVSSMRMRWNNESGAVFLENFYQAHYSPDNCFTCLEEEMGFA